MRLWLKRSRPSESLMGFWRDKKYIAKALTRVNQQNTKWCWGGSAIHVMSKLNRSHSASDCRWSVALMILQMVMSVILSWKSEMKENWVHLRNSLFPKEFGFIFCMIRSSRITKVFITHSSFIPMTRPPSLNYISSLPIFILTFNCSNGQFTFVASLPYHFHFQLSLSLSSQSKCTYVQN